MKRENNNKEILKQISELFNEMKCLDCPLIELCDSVLDDGYGLCDKVFKINEKLNGD